MNKQLSFPLAPSGIGDGAYVVGKVAATQLSPGHDAITADALNIKLAANGPGSAGLMTHKEKTHLPESNDQNKGRQ